MATVRGVTARYLGGFQSPQTRLRYKKDIMLWQKFCLENGYHALNCQTAICQEFVNWMALTKTPGSVRARVAGVSGWFDAMVAARIVPSNGMRGVKTPKLGAYCPSESPVGDADVDLVMRKLADVGPRWEWLLGMVAFGGCEPVDAVRVRGVDVRTWEGRTLVRVRSRYGHVREIPVDGRLEVLTLGLSQVFAPSSPLGGVSSPVYVANKLRKVASEAVGRPVTMMDLRRYAIRRQYARGVAPEVIAAWLGHNQDLFVRRTLGLPSAVKAVKQQQMLDSIVIEDDGGRFGSGLAPDSLIVDHL